MVANGYLQYKCERVDSIGLGWPKSLVNGSKKKNSECVANEQENEPNIAFSDNDKQWSLVKTNERKKNKTSKTENLI